MEKIPEERFNRGRPESSISTGRPWSGSKGVQAEAYSLEPIAEPPGIERETRQRSMSQPQQRDSGEERTPTLTDSCIQAFMRVFPCCPLSPSASNEADDPASGPAEVSISRAGDEPTEPGANERSSYRSSSPPLSRGRGREGGRRPYSSHRGPLDTHGGPSSSDSGPSRSRDSHDSHDSRDSRDSGFSVSSRGLRRRIRTNVESMWENYERKKEEVTEQEVDLYNREGSEIIRLVKDFKKACSNLDEEREKKVKNAYIQMTEGEDKKTIEDFYSLKQELYKLNEGRKNVPPHALPQYASSIYPKENKLENLKKCFEEIKKQYPQIDDKVNRSPEIQKLQGERSEHLTLLKKHATALQEGINSANSENLEENNRLLQAWSNEVKDALGTTSPTQDLQKQPPLYTSIQGEKRRQYAVMQYIVLVNVYDDAAPSHEKSMLLLALGQNANILEKLSNQ